MGFRVWGSWFDMLELEPHVDQDLHNSFLRLTNTFNETDSSNADLKLRIKQRHQVLLWV